MRQSAESSKGIFTRLNLVLPFTNQNILHRLCSGYYFIYINRLQTKDTWIVQHQSRKNGLWLFFVRFCFILILGKPFVFFSFSNIASAALALTWEHNPASLTRLTIPVIPTVIITWNIWFYKTNKPQSIFSHINKGKRWMMTPIYLASDFL